MKSIMYRKKFYSNFVISILFLFMTICIFNCKNITDSEKTKESLNQVKFNYIKLDTTTSAYPFAKCSGDLNGDGINNIIIGGKHGPLVWYEYPNLKKHKIADGGYSTVDGEVGDIDGDGDLDIIMGGMVWYENPENLLEIPDQIWAMHQISDHSTHDVEISDLNKDGRMDVISRDQSEFGSKAGNTIHLWMNKNEWEEIVLDCPHGEGIVVEDLDSDDDTDIIISGFWFENVLRQGQVKWVKHQFADWHKNANVQVADINKDGRNDVVLVPAELAGEYYKISWFEAPEDLIGENWIEHIIFDSVECVMHSLSLGDIDNNGSVDIAYAEMHQGEDPDEVVILLNHNKGESWKKQVLSQTGSHGLRVDDVNGDNNLDIFGSNWSSAYHPIEILLIINI